MFGNFRASMCTWPMSPELSLIATTFLDRLTRAKYSSPIETPIRPG